MRITSLSSLSGVVIFIFESDSLKGARVANRRKCNDEFSNYGQNAIRITILPELLTALKLAKESCIKILVIAPG